jgi:Fe-S oxidoreductase
VFDEPREALDAMGLELREMDSHGPTQYCCGGGAGVMLIERAAPLRQRAFEIKMRQVDDTGAAAVVTSCESCRMNFAVGGVNANWQMPVKSLVELVAENLA